MIIRGQFDFVLPGRQTRSMGKILQTANQPAGSLLLSAQNDCGFALFVNNFSLTSGQWDPQLTPQQGQETDPGQTGEWKVVSGWPLQIAGSMTQAVAQTGMLNVTWQLSVQSFTSNVTKMNWTRSDIDATLVQNIGVGNNVWLQLLVAYVATARDETLRVLAQRKRIDVSVLAQANGLAEDAALRAGQRVLLASRWPDFNLWRRRSSISMPEDPPESS